MKRIKFFVGLTSLLVAGSVHAQQDPTRIGAGQLPFILVVLDTSGSTEWTQEGDDEFPKGSASAPGPDKWEPGLDMEADGNNDGPHRFGPCFVWEPSNCNNYHRPGWSPNVKQWGYQNDDEGFLVPNNAHLRARMRAMRGGSTHGPGVRFDRDSLPRHVILKEAMTGSMVLRNYDQQATRIENLGSIANSPGCWFVPRQRGASVQPNDQDFCDSSEFEDFPDYDEPLPHFQEVFDGQLANGLMDSLFTSAIFGFAGLDGFREDHDWDSDSDMELNDTISHGSAPTGPTRPDRVRNTVNEDSGDFNLGLSRIVAPTTLDIEQRFLANIADHVQLALVDSGYLSHETSNPWKVKVGHEKKDGRSELGITYQQGADQYLDDLYLGRQPIARATPLAAAMMDARQFLTSDPRFSVSEDPYAQCRPKQVVILTDGTPFPEAPGGAGNELGNVGLSSAFGYDNCSGPWINQEPPAGCQYGYDTTEEEIAGLISAARGTLTSGSPQVTGADLARFQSRVHVVGLDVGTTPEERANIVDKLSEMAIAGETCAEFFLRATPFGAITAADTWIPESEGGGCKPGDENVSPRGCLVPGQRVYSNYVTPDGTTWDQPCKFPALILSRNSPEGIAQAMSTVFNGIIGSAGVASRTRAVVSDFLDDDSQLGGGQYRIYSGSRISGSRFWRGILNRELLPCDNTLINSFAEGAGVDTGALGDPALESVIYRALHADVADQVSCDQVGSICNPATKADNRRIFTAIPTDAVFDYITREPRPIDTTNAVDTMFATRFPLYALPESSDEFREVTIPGVSPANTSKTVGTRVPFHSAEIFAAILATTTNHVAALTYFDILEASALDGVVDVHRGRIPEKAAGANGSPVRRSASRVITGILNATPVVVPPPVRDIPSESYRDYRSVYGGRPTMLYASTTDGQLHAIHAGELKGRIAVREMTSDGAWINDREYDDNGAFTRNSANALVLGQREAWSFIPPMVLRDLPSNSDTQPYLMDGSPVVKDVRLCQKSGANNQNVQACGVAGSSTLTGAQQWRTVLVQGRGLAGEGYYAIDVTRPGGLRVDAGLTTKTIQKPDPVFLWEFNADWEKAQAAYLHTEASARIGATNNPAACSSPPSDFWARPMLGTNSVSTPEIATLAVNVGSGANIRLEQRPVAVFGGGLGSTDGCSIEGSGSAIYVVDLQTGSILRRFVADVGGTPFVTHGSVFTGSPSLYDSSTGAVATFGFIGDSDGRMWSMDFRKPNPAEWTVTLALDPLANTSSKLQPLKNMVNSITDGKVGPASGKPSIAMGPQRRLVVTYGLGEPGDTTSGTEAQAVITLIQSESVPGSYDINWVLVFNRGEKMTGDSLTFNGVTYFPTYAQEPTNSCAPGYARIYGVKYVSELGSPESAIDATLLGNPGLCPNFGACGANSPETAGLWFGPKEPTLIRGLTLTLGPICAARGLGDDPAGFEDSGGAVGQPQLIAQTGAMPDATIPGEYLSPKGGADAIGRITVDIARRQGPVVPLSWISIQ